MIHRNFPHFPRLAWLRQARKAEPTRPSGAALVTGLLDAAARSACAIVLLLFLLPFSVAHGDILISEFLASNDQGLKDEDGETSDWIEIHNTGPDSVNLVGWHLTDDPEQLAKWTFPSILLFANDYLVVYASSKDRSPTSGQLHTNFNLSRDGEYLALIEPDGATIAFAYAPEFPAQTPDISFGIRLPGLTRLFFTTPTPGTENNTGFDGTVAEVEAAPGRGLYESPIAVTLTTETPSATIHYTLDGSEPTQDHGTLYSGTIDLATTGIIRAAAYKEGYLPSEVVTFSYIFPGDVVNQPANPPGFPSSWKGTSASYGMNSEYPESDETIVEALRSLPSLSVVADPEDMFGSSGFYPNGGFNANDPWERPGSIELIYPDGRTGFQANTGVQGRSSAGSSERKRGLKFDFKSKYGPSKLEFPLFQDAMEGADTAAPRFDSLNLRSGKTENYTGSAYRPELVIHFRDPMVRDAEIAMTGDGTRNIFVHLYMNGLYWGVFNLTEAHEPDYYSTYFGGRDSDWFQVKAKDRSDTDGNDGLFERDDAAAVDRYLGFLEFVANADLSLAENYDRAVQDIDPVTFADYIILYSFYAVGDWPDNNWTFIMRNGEDSRPGRFLSWDAEKAWLEYSDNQANRNAWYSPWLRTEGGPDYQPTIKRIWQGLIQNAAFRRLFADRAYLHTHHDGALSDANFKARFDAWVEKLDLAIRADQMRWTSDTRSQFPNRMFTYADWLARVDRVRSNTLDNVNDFITAFRLRGLYPQIDPPVFSVHGGEVAPDDLIELTAPAGDGTVYYTLDGSDPRLPASDGGGINPKALRYDGAFVVSGIKRVKTRLLEDGEWSALNAVTFNGNLEELEERIVDYFDMGAFSREGTRFFANWLGDFDAGHFPWIAHSKLDWVFAPGEEQEWLYTIDLGWFWTDENLFPAIWSHNRQAWLRFLVEQPDTEPGPWFFDFAEDEWFRLQ